MMRYESPTLTKIGGVTELTQGDLFQQGQDRLSWIPIFGNNDPRPPGGGFGS